MGDMEKVVAECKLAQAEGREISDACARVIASMYHTGQASFSYSLASTGFIGTDSTHVWGEMFRDGYPRMTADEKLVADMMGTYLVQRIVNAHCGPVEGWSGLWL